MAYPLPLQYDDERKERRDYEYMKSLYPDVAKRLLPYIEEECDRMEYDNSMMYDEYPDRLQLHLMCKRVCENVRKHEKIFYGTEYEGLLSQAEENSVMQMEEAERMQEPESEWEPEFMQVQEQNRREPERIDAEVNKKVQEKIDAEVDAQVKEKINAEVESAVEITKKRKHQSNRKTHQRSDYCTVQV